MQLRTVDIQENQGGEALGKGIACRIVAGVVAVVVLSGAPVMVRAQGADAQSDFSAAQPKWLQGTWSVQVTRRDCQTDAALPGPPIPALLTFARGGTIIDSAGSPPPGFAPAQRSIGLGTWRHERGHTYRADTVMLTHFDSPAGSPPPGFRAGWQTITQEINLTDRDNFTAIASTQFFDSAGQLYRSGCSMAVGRRFE